jgi:hypothetical protein
MSTKQKKGKYQRREPPVGRLVQIAGKEKRQSTVRFDSDLFDEVAAFARDQQTTFNEAVATLCEWGLEAEGK